MTLWFADPYLRTLFGPYRWQRLLENTWNCLKRRCQNRRNSWDQHRPAVNGAAPCHRSSPVCRINEKLANTAFASSFFAQKCVLVFVWSLFSPNDTKRYATLHSICAVCAHDTFVSLWSLFSCQLKYVWKQPCSFWAGLCHFWVNRSFQGTLPPHCSLAVCSVRSSGCMLT